VSWWDRLWADRGPVDAWLERLLEDASTGWVVGAVAVVVAVGVGAAHALGPGHGKLLIGGYLAGTRGRPRDAVALGVLVAAMHTASVLVLGLALGAATAAPRLARIEGALLLALSVAVVALGVRMVLRARRARAASDHPHPHPHPHDHGHHDHDHELPPGLPPLSRAGILAIAGSGGLLPSPTALVVLVSALAVGRPAYGVLLVGAFSLGLALTLIGLGMLVLRGRDRLAAPAGHARIGRSLAARLPYAGGAVVLLGGVVLAARGVAAL
jgi:nickel/cobalt transporter (NicO) family protein